ncbi:MAG: DUF1552 domain-containing protein [Planctomycetota bacterium]|jgi:hypothetical protein
MKRSWNIERRTFLRGAGAALALPLLDIMGPTGRAMAAKAGAPTRFVTVFHPNGVYPAAWDVTGVGKAFEFSPILAPLKNLRDDITILSNLDNEASGGHVAMTSAFLTGVGVKDHRCAVSLDQVIARKIGGDTMLPSITLGTEPPRQGGAGAGKPIAYANTISWTSATTRISPEINPAVAFDRMFRTRSSKAARRRARDQRSVLDVVMSDAKSLRAKASKADQHKLDEYLESVRSTEVSIEKSLNPPKRSWQPASMPELVRPEDRIPRERDLHLKLMIDLMVLALQTDITRVGTLMTAHGFSRQNFSFLDGVNSDHHGMSHHKDEDKAIREYTQVSTWYASQFAYMLEKLKGIDENGVSLLDNSTIVYGSSMKDGNGHVRKNLPIILAGRGGGTLNPAGRLVLDQATPLANLHVTIMNKFGIEGDSFNGLGTGPIDQLQPVA